MPLLDLGPQESLLSQPQLFLFSALLRASYYDDAAQRMALAACCGPANYFTSTLSVPDVPLWFGLAWGNWQLIVCAGTANEEQWIGNVLGVNQTTFPQYPGSIHTYFGYAANAIYANIQAVMTPTSPLTNCVVIGHSLGGAIGNLLAWRINTTTPGACKWVFTEGCPRIGNLAWTLAPTWPILSFRNTGDIVPYVPPERGFVSQYAGGHLNWGPCEDYYPVGDLWDIGGSGRPFPHRVLPLVQNDWALVAQALTQGFNPRALSHIAGQYAQRISYWGTFSDMPQQGSPLGINVAQVYAWQAAFGAVDGFIWQATP